MGYLTEGTTALNTCHNSCGIVHVTLMVLGQFRKLTKEQKSYGSAANVTIYTISLLF